MKNAALIIIGNEILSGRTQDINVKFIAENLNKLGISLVEVRIISDVEATIIYTVNYIKTLYDYIFITGGIGPTHDDITSQSIAKACGVELEQNEEAYNLLKKYYEGTNKLNEARLKMAKIPVGAELIYNPVSAAPGFIIENIYVMAGVPKIMQAMFDGVKHKLVGGNIIYSKELVIYRGEGDIAEELTKIQDNFPDCEIGSYPFFKNNVGGTVIVVRSENKESICSVMKLLNNLL